MKVTFYGVRGSIAAPGKDTVKYGGNTSCVLVEPGDDTVLVFDAGTGIRGLGELLVSDSRDIYLLFSHHHWDHIQGLPFFRPIYQRGRKIRLLSNNLNAGDASSVLDQMSDSHFPVTGAQLQAEIEVAPFNDQGSIMIGDTRVSTMPLNHPGGGSGYRIDTAHSSLVYITDNELFPPNEVQTAYPEWVNFIQGVDLLIHDAMFVDDELQKVRGWGHSLISQALQLALDADVKRLLLFHHDPSRSDAQLDEILADSREWMASHSAGIEVFVAREGESYQL
ncbi:MAG TPA: MBL fold metallo-hydrolase [Gammaproteobacteria bacterium]|nr:MBL fold metallo-hydrolase [Gammaproteobacteria bacterium]